MKIISTDLVFAEALQITLHRAGLFAEIAPSLPVTPSSGELLVVDLDCLGTSSLSPSPTVTFSRDPNTGADFIRPFLMRELTAHLLKLAGNRSQAEPISRSDVPFLRLTPDGALLQGRPIALSPAERTLLALLLETPGECVPTAVIDGLWEEKGGNTTAVYIRYLRKKLDEPTGLRLIRTIRGRGYCLCLPE